MVLFVSCVSYYFNLPSTLEWNWVNERILRSLNMEENRQIKRKSYENLINTTTIAHCSDLVAGSFVKCVMSAFTLVYSLVLLVFFFVCLCTFGSVRSKWNTKFCIRKKGNWDIKRKSHFFRENMVVERLYVVSGITRDSRISVV